VPSSSCHALENGPICFQTKKKSKKTSRTRTPTVGVVSKGSGAGKCTIATWTNEAVEVQQRSTKTMVGNPKKWVEERLIKKIAVWNSNQGCQVDMANEILDFLQDFGILI